MGSPPLWANPLFALTPRGDGHLLRSACKFAPDSPLEESGFEPLVPLTLNQANAGEREEIGAGIWRILAKSHPTNG